MSYGNTIIVKSMEIHMLTFREGDKVVVRHPKGEEQESSQGLIYSVYGKMVGTVLKSFISLAGNEMVTVQFPNKGKTMYAHRLKLFDECTFPCEWP